MNWLKALGFLVPFGIVLSAVTSVVLLGTGLAAPPESVSVAPAAATLALVVLVVVGLLAVGGRSRRWLSRQYW
ncbi:hypothetical protein [Haloarchaeobius iranensis]|uniref:Uncharacterized protein n=1 Tax=Haloarchaeobius iranensis TaxID=996166 RepID=A0A1G9TZH3_9EURY|nr:hypothetical protein [Haloarchaeobius iranensis]SDM52804.1 hypothetical protein SAMN05192554_103207 [Haloarchaeobius iranensis]